MLPLSKGSTESLLGTLSLGHGPGCAIRGLHLIMIFMLCIVFHMSCFALQKTRIGMSVNVLRKASSKEDLQGLAKSLIKSWKKLLGIYCFCFPLIFFRIKDLQI